MAEIPSEYDAFGESFARSRKGMRWEEVADLCGRLKRDFRHPSVLDAGCGSGRLRDALDAVFDVGGYRYLGIDASRILVECAKKESPQADFLVCDMRSIPGFPAVTERRPFDAIFAIASFHHLAERSDRVSVLRDFARISHPGGFLLMTNWNLLSVSNLSRYGKFRTGDGNFAIPFSGKTRTYVPFTEDGLRAELLEAGWVPETLVSNEKNLVCVARLPEG